MSREVRVRYAPSPTGHLHIGGARTALFNYLFAKHHGGQFLLRIEDTDIARNIADGEQSQKEYLQWLGVNWDEGVDIGGDYGPYRQTERLDIYEKYWNALLDKGLAYKDYHTKEELLAEREEQLARGEQPRYSGSHRNLTPEQEAAFVAAGRVPSVRFRIPAGHTYAFDDMVKGPISFDGDGFGDFVIVKQNGIPTYNFAVVLDDHLMKISHVLRGEEHISNTPLQLMIYEAFGWEAPQFGHMTLIVNDQHKKLSKRDESIIQFISQYADLGYLPEAMLNFIALLGWSPVGEQEIFSKEELIAQFDPARLSKSPAVFDQAKLSWMNNDYMKRLDNAELTTMCVTQLQRAGKLPNELTQAQQVWASRLAALFQEKLHAASEIVPLTELYFTEEPPVISGEATEVLAEEQVPTVISAFITELNALPDDFEAQDVKKALKTVQKSTGFKGKQLFMPIRAKITGEVHGADLNESIVLLGKDRVLRWLQA